MLKSYSLKVILVVGLILPNSLYAQETLKFGWPDGASAKVHVRNQGKRVGPNKPITWDMTLDFTMNVKRVNDRVVVSRNGVSGWKGNVPPSIAGGAERFFDMVPTIIVTKDGLFVGIEGHETARKLMNDSVAQTGGLDPVVRNAFDTITSNASIESMAKDHWSSMVALWRDVELDPGVFYEMSNVTPVPQLGGGEIEIKGTVKFVKAAPCETTRNDQRCAHLQAELIADQAQVRKILQSFVQQAAGSRPNITAFDRHFKVDIVLDKTTMLPHQLRLTRGHSLTMKNPIAARDETSSEEVLTTYTFTWL